ncbi:hypothetical protein QUF74_12425 [Candidatus Halobeggiatoa sp. HSG11]|nr:hypothetical protein [Candidatus Halobeggiatoa sp. HSG11]
MLLLFPILKLFHELAHAFTAKYYGGEVHELGILILVFMPLPYVEASSASAFPSKKARIMVDSAGIMIELFIAALAMMLWINIEPGLIRSIAYNTMFICSISTLLFNGNPLLRFDGYYILADAIEIPNLVSRSKRYLGYLFQRYLINIKALTSPAESLGEAGWLVFYGIAAFCYRIFISAVIIFFVANEFFIIGVLIAIWAVYLFLLAPILKNINYLITNPTMQTRKLRIFLVLSIFIGGLGYGLFWLPIPLWSNVEGVIWPPEQSHVRVKTSGFCKKILVQPEEQVIAGQPLIILEDIELEAEYLILQHQLAELEARYTALWNKNFPEAIMLKEKMASIKADLVKHEKQLQRLTVLSPQDGLIYIPHHERLLEHFLQQGELVAYVVKPPINIVMAIVQQKDIALVKQGVERVEVRLADNREHIYTAEISRSVPKASDYLPSKVLSTAGGGSIPTDPADPDNLKTYEPIFQYEVKLPDELSINKIGGRVYLRFYHEKEALGWQWYRLIRQLFLRSFDM